MGGGEFRHEGNSEVLNQRSGQYFYAHAFNILRGSAFLLVQIQNRLYSISSLPLKAGPVRRGCRASLASSYTYGISIICHIACLVGMYLSSIFACTKLSHDCVHVLDVVMIF